LVCVFKFVMWYCVTNEGLNLMHPDSLQI
jgi:hypothetical protein